MVTVEPTSDDSTDGRRRPNSPDHFKQGKRYTGGLSVSDRIGRLHRRRVSIGRISIRFVFIGRFDRQQYEIILITMDCEKLISLVEERRSLWNNEDAAYHNRDIARRLWNEIANLLENTSEYHPLQIVPNLFVYIL